VINSDHGRGVVEVFLATDQGRAPDYDFKDRVKLHKLAQELGVESKNRSISEIAVDVGEIALVEFGKPEGMQLMARWAPQLYVFSNIVSNPNFPYPVICCPEFPYA
jgi:carbon-monoxide dehydrogenase catalytic subunit